MTATAWLIVAIAAAAPQGDHVLIMPGALEGRPAARNTSPLQARIDAATAGSRLVVEAGDFRGDLVVDRPVTLVGRGRPRLIGSGAGSVIRVRAGNVTIEGFDIDGSAGGDLSRDSSGIHIAGEHVTVRDCRVVNSLFGIFLRAATSATVERCSIRGIPGRDPGEKGSGIHVWNTERFSLIGNTIVDVRDGIYIQSSPMGRTIGNVARDVRYGLHYMSSDDNVFEDNLFENGAAGTAIMYSRRLEFRRNRFIRNRGFASVGLLFQTCDDVVAEDNLVADNARGIFLEGTHRCAFRRNVIAGSDTAIVLYDNAKDTIFEGNSFVGNMTPLLLVGRRTDTAFDGNYWSGNQEPDLDGDGRCDRPYRLSTAFDHFRGNLTAADLFADGFASAALGVAEHAFPVLQAVQAVDRVPLARPPSLPAVPRPAGPQPAYDAIGMTGTAALAFAGLAALWSGGRRRKVAGP